jgi:malonyl-CoA decarboxylase
MSDRVRLLLDPKSAVNAPQSVSLLHCQLAGGLRGVPFGSLLIKQVVEDLNKSLPRIRTFLTLSPIPGFRKWLAAHMVTWTRASWTRE